MRALYDVAQYEQALEVFRALEETALASGSQENASFGILWQGHLLDLLGRREEATARYQRVLACGYDGQWTHS